MNISSCWFISCHACVCITTMISLRAWCGNKPQTRNLLFQLV
jgi:hypothetical protein